MPRGRMQTAAMALASGFAAIVSLPATAAATNHATLEVGQTLAGGYVITQRYGPGAFLARRDGDLFFVRGDNITRLDPRYPIGAQLEDIDKRNRRLSND